MAVIFPESPHVDDVTRVSPQPGVLSTVDYQLQVIVQDTCPCPIWQERAVQTISSGSLEEQWSIAPSVTEQPALGFVAVLEDSELIPSVGFLYELAKLSVNAGQWDDRRDFDMVVYKFLED